MLKKIRIIIASLSLILITLLFTDFSGFFNLHFRWMAKIQFLPAVLSLNLGIVIVILLITFFLGRVYCSVICPLGIIQDLFAWFGRKVKKNRYYYSPAKNWLRYSILILFIITMVFGINSIALLIAPYSAYGRMASALFSPIYQWTNNLIVYIAQKVGAEGLSYYEVGMKSLFVLIVAGITFAALLVLAWRNGRTYCNTICPVGTVLGTVSKYSLIRPSFDIDNCNGCGLCARNCRASCIDHKNKTIDYSRCVACMDCISKCRNNGIKLNSILNKVKKSQSPVVTSSIISPIENNESQGTTRREFISLSALLAITATVTAQEKKVKEGVSLLMGKTIPQRSIALKPAGSESLAHFTKHCTACQLCVTACPNHLLVPSQSLLRFMQPDLSFEQGFCSLDCNKCSQVCPTGAIKPIEKEDKKKIQIGHAVWMPSNCLINTFGARCGRCARVCPMGAITMTPVDASPDSRRIPIVDLNRCIGCGACENACPVDPEPAIYINGYQQHRIINA